MKTLRAFLQILRGQELTYKERRRVDDFLHEVKVATLTLITLTIIMYVITREGCFELKEPLPTSKDIYKHEIRKY